MMKHLLIIPILISALACAPIKQKIEDRTGGCVNGNCSQKPLPKPTVCSGAGKFTALSGTFKTEPVTNVGTGVTYRAQFIFGSGKVLFTQFCENKKTKEFESPTLESDFSVNSQVSALKFTTPQVKEVKSASFVCKAELTAEVFDISAQGNCLALKPEKDDVIYYVRQAN